MKYRNASDILPDELLETVRRYYQGGYLYIPKENDFKAGRKTEYKTELEKRDRQIYLKRLEGRTNRQLGMMYHLSEPSIRRILAKERLRYREMEEIIKEILPLWGMDSGLFSQIYPSAWRIVKAVIAGYESVTKLSGQEKGAVCCVMQCIEILFAAYFIGEQDIKSAKDARRIFGFIQNSEEDLKHL